MPPNLRSVIAQRYYLGGRSIRNFCSTPPVSSNVVEPNGVVINAIEWFVSRCVGLAMGYGIGVFTLDRAVPNVTEKKEAKLRQCQEHLEQLEGRLEKMFHSKP